MMKWLSFHQLVALVTRHKTVYLWHLDSYKVIMCYGYLVTANQWPTVKLPTRYLYTVCSSQISTWTPKVVDTQCHVCVNWFKANKLSVNATKTNNMITGTPKMTSMIDQTDIILDNTKLDRATTSKFLGVIIDKNLTWKNHIDGITKTISRNIGMINKLKFFVPEWILRTLYRIDILIWGQACKTYLEKIHKLQKWVLRIISNSHYRSHSMPLFLKYDILNVYDMYKLEVGVFM